MASCTDTREQTYLNKQRVGTGPAVIDGQYTLAAVDKFAEDLAKDILKDHQLSVPIQPIKTPKESLSRPSYSALATEKTLTP